MANEMKLDETKLTIELNVAELRTTMLALDEAARHPILGKSRDVIVPLVKRLSDRLLQAVVEHPEPYTKEQLEKDISVIREAFSGRGS